MVSTIHTGDVAGNAAWRSRLGAAARAGAFREAFGEWVRVNTSAVNRACRRLARHQRVYDPRTAADDLFAETMLVAFQKLPRALATNPELVVLGFVLTTCLRSAFERLGFRVRQRGKQPPATECRFDDLDQTGGAAFDPLSPDAGPDEVCERADLSAKLWAAIDALPPPLRELVVLNRLEGQTLEHIATAHGVPVGTLKTRSVKAMAMLRERLHAAVN